MKIDAKVTREGVQTLRKLRKATEAVPTDALDAVNEAAQMVFSTSQRYVPVDTGNLKASGRLLLGNLIAPVATVLYGADYAAIVHETHATQSQYLNRAVDLVMAELPEDVAERIEVRYK